MAPRSSVVGRASNSPLRSPPHPAPAAGASSVPLDRSVARDIDEWLERSLPLAGQSNRYVNFYDDVEDRDTSQDVLRRVADAIRRVATGESARLVVEWGLPAKTLPDAIGQLQGLQELSLTNTGLTSLPESLGQLGQLRHLKLATNQEMKRLPASLTSLPNLHTLQLPANSLKELPADLGRMQSLRTLELGNGKYASLPASITDLRHLTHLSVSHSSHIRELPENIGDMQGLQTLVLKGNTKLERLPDSVGDLANLQSLDLEGTKLQTLPQSLARLPAHCEIKVPDHLRRQLQQIRNPQAAQQAAQASASRTRPPTTPVAGQAGPSRSRGSELRRALRRLDPDLSARFDKWRQGLSHDAMMFGQPLTPADTGLLDQIVTEAIASPEFRSSFSQFLGEHTLKAVDADGMTQVHGGPALAGDVITGFSIMLEHKIMHVQHPGVALDLMRAALRDPGLRMSRHELLNDLDPLAPDPDHPRIWPPLRAYVTMHDELGKAAQDAAATWVSAQLYEAGLEDGMPEAEALEESRLARESADSYIKARAEELLKEWDIR
ncbi:type III secretion system effector XopAE [Acidovorax sp. SUPP2522]|uniref:leucine-rich repeat domain-containing protein n=1 Tax=unclassified Acidovorax TaxID=2684926 RepID=UPI00234B060A|nr:MULTISPECIES: hypothetical protein [unclassified Acidovorax]WCM96680.1 hypothetical protein M5C96_19970 [Acidovorax sp. GBBC 1281]GKT18979.1 type III secretion system effector XopAE [Acidovorax sp. SUPP2522]